MIARPLAERSTRHSQELAKQGSGVAAGPELAGLRWKSETGWSTKKPPKQSIWRATKELTPYEKRQKGSARGEDGTKWHFSQSSAPTWRGMLTAIPAPIAAKKNSIWQRKGKILIENEPQPEPELHRRGPRPKTP